jgi:hypothetical protein
LYCDSRCGHVSYELETPLFPLGVREEGNIDFDPFVTAFYPAALRFPHV